MAYEEHRQAGAPIVARCHVLTVSDTRTLETDHSGQRIAELLAGQGHVVVDRQVVPDDADQIEVALSDALARPDVDVVITNGGTGISRRDRTVTVVEDALDASLPGFGELFRMLSWDQIGSGAMLSRAVAGVSRGKPVFALPGSSKAVELAMTKLILPELGHLLSELRK
jgi:molybdenum cofactor biosynthesis protein B